MENLNDYLNSMADELTNEIMSYVYGERFDKTDDITEDEELSKAWDYVNDITFGGLWAAWDKAIASEYEEI